MNNQLQNLLFILQLEEYDTKRFLRWTKTHKLTDIKEDKKQLKWTLKARIVFFLARLLTLVGLNPASTLTLAVKFLFLPELIVKNTIVTLAQIKLKFHPKLQVIGITGSYGKTSVKEVLYQILSAKYKVIKTPENYNTPLGIAKTILSSNLNANFLIAEMGAYHIGDIKKMCELYKPKYGILTAIGPQHLERFGSIKEIASAKSELFFSLIYNGLAVTDADNKYCLDIAGKTPDLVQMFTLKRKFNHTDKYKMMFVDNIKVHQNGTDFRINYYKLYNIHTKLLGEHNVRNIMSAIVMARYLLLDWETIIKSVAQLNFIPHRLEIINGANNTLIIDDSYNANPDSVKSALSVLKEIDAPRKIVITPGLVELGKNQEKENELFGEEISAANNYLIVVGQTNKDSLKKGFFKKGESDHLLEAATLNEATKKLQQIVIPKSVILFENDLPDQYL